MPAVKLWADEDEFWPWFYLSEGPVPLATVIEVDDQTAARWMAALEAARIAQAEIREAVRCNL